MIPQMTVVADLTRSEDELSLKPGNAGGRLPRQGFSVCVRHNDCRLKTQPLPGNLVTHSQTCPMPKTRRTDSNYGTMIAQAIVSAL